VHVANQLFAVAACRSTGKVSSHVSATRWTQLSHLLPTPVWRNGKVPFQ